MVNQSRVIPPEGVAAMSPTPTPVDDSALEELLSRPSSALVADMQGIAGDLVILGAGGKMGPTLAVLARRALDAAGRRDVAVTAVSGWSDAAAADRLRAAGVCVHTAKLGLDSDLAQLPDAAYVAFLIGAKFGVSSRPYVAWQTNAVLPALVARRYRDSRIAALSTGNVYPFVEPRTGGCREDQAPSPIGEYAMSCLGRERAFDAVSSEFGTPAAIIRLNYAVELRYGVITDLATRVLAGEAIDVTSSHVNVVWQRYANEVVLRSLLRADSPPLVLNVTGAETLGVADLATRLGELLDRPAVLTGEPAATCLLSDARRCLDLFGPPDVDVPTLLRWQADWLSRDGTVWAKPTKFERRSGQF
jgi:dTDP-4-dehydrorhamnose reductase